MAGKKTDKRHIRYSIFILTVTVVTVIYAGIFSYFLYGAVKDVQISSNFFNRFIATASEAAPADEWRLYTGFASGISYRYPNNFSSEYIEPISWPPIVEILNEEFSCINGEYKIISGKEYCLEKTIEYSDKDTTTSYSYSFPQGGMIKFIFSISEDNCSNYSGDEKRNCETEQAFFDPDLLMANMRETFTIETAPVAAP